MAASSDSIKSSSTSTDDLGRGEGLCRLGRIESEEMKLFRKQGFVVVKNVLSGKDVKEMCREINCLEKYLKSKGLVDKSTCDLDPFENLKIPESSPARTRVGPYLSLRSHFLSQPSPPKKKKRKIERGETLSAKKRRVRGEGNGGGERAGGDVGRVIFEVLPQVCRKVLGWESVYLFNCHYIVKQPKSDVSFGWHRDGEEQLGMWFNPHTSQIASAWCALDPMSGENGSLTIRPYPTSFEGKEREDIVIEIGVGDCVLLSSNVWHMSGPNLTSIPRRVAYAQYSSAPLTVPPHKPPPSPSPSCSENTKPKPNKGINRVDPSPLAWAIRC
ncbi:hypothetical protein AAMO2058_000325200 [Amorphochlora amoebiformis]